MDRKREKMVLTLQEVIKKKRDGEELGPEEINFFVRSVVNGEAHDAQIGAWLMAVFLKGMTDTETANLTKSMTYTGEYMRWDASWKNLLVDKHSTGGVGDKVSLILAPALAACGLKIPMLSGRSLGFTGGTLDKLESIPGYRVDLTPEEMHECLDKVGCFVAGPAQRLAVADKILYNCRDLTNTVDCIPLIVSSILSKKAAEGTETLIVDVKVGCGTFLKNEEEASILANKLMKVSELLNIETTAVLSDMSVPLGHYVGNALEVQESVQCLRNEGSVEVKSLVKSLGGLLLKAKGIVTNAEEGENEIEKAIENQTALSKFKEMLVYQGVAEVTASKLCDGNFSEVLPRSKYITTYSTEESGTITDINAASIGMFCWHLGVGRSKPNQSVNYAAGIHLLKLVGDKTDKGEDWIKIHHDTEINNEMEMLIKKSILIVPFAEVNKKASRIIKTF